MNRKFLNTLLLLLLSGQFAWADTAWESAKDEEGIRVYTREVDGWDVEEFKVITIMKVKRYIIFETLMNVAAYTTWYPDIVHAEVCKTVSEKEFYWYSQIDLPWPTEDRDSECHVIVTHNKEEKTSLISLTACEKYKSRQDGYTRMTKGKGFWKLTSREDGSTTVHYQYLSDPGGSIPDWITNMFIVDNPFNTVKALKTKVNG